MKHERGFDTMIMFAKQHMKGNYMAFVLKQPSISTGTPKMVIRYCLCLVGWAKT